MASGRLKDLPPAFLTEMKAILATETRKTFVQNKLSEASHWSERMLKQDLGSLINEEVTAALDAMQKWQKAKIRMAERELSRRERETEGIGLQEKLTQESLEREVSWYMERIEKLEQIHRNYSEKQAEYVRLADEYNSKCERLRGFLRFATRENMQMYPKVLRKSTISPLPKRMSATPEPISTSTSGFINTTQQRAVSVLKGNLLKTQRSLSTLRLAVKEKRSISPISCVSERERFFQDSLQRLVPKPLQSTEKGKGPWLRVRSSIVGSSFKLKQHRLPFKSLEEFKCMKTADVFSLLASNALAQRHLQYATFHSAV